MKKHSNPKPVGHGKSSPKGKVHSNTGTPQETTVLIDSCKLHNNRLYCSCLSYNSALVIIRCMYV